MRHYLTAILVGAAFTLSPVVSAQAQHDDHDGHDHSAHAPDTSNISEAIKAQAFAIAPEDHVIGQADAPVTMIVYASVTCPHCAQWFAQDYPVLKRDYIDTGKAKMVFREFPTAPGPVAVAGFLIANCSGDQFIDSVVYQMDQQEETFAALKSAQGEADIMSVFNNMGAQTGLDEAATLDCINDQNGFGKIQRSMDRARAAGISGVPAISIGQTMYTLGDTSAGPLSTVIDAKLAQ